MGNVNFESIFDWKYAGFTKDHSYDRKRFDEVWIWQCPRCGHEERRPFGNQNKPKMACPVCIQKTSNSVNGSGEAVPWTE